MSDNIDAALGLFEKYIPINTHLTIEEYHSFCSARYVMRLHYRSSKSDKTICVMAKGENLPIEDCELLHFYLRQLVLTPREVAREFSRVYFYERRARQEEFLFSNNNVRVAQDKSLKDKLDFAGYNG